MLHRYAVLVSGATWLLVIAGALVTSTGSGLAVPDWPTTYGQFMFSFPFSRMVGGILYEHGHRMIATLVGLLMIVLAVWLAIEERRRWVRRLGVIALGTVILQGILGGITVLYLLPAPISVGHAGLAQIFFCLTVSLALFTSRGWRTGYQAERIARDDPESSDAPLRRLSLAMTIVIYTQILLGATMRHIGAGLAIPDFPLAFGRVIPPQFTTAIAVHFAHRVGAILVMAIVAATFFRVMKRHRIRRELVAPALWLASLLATQLGLGALTIWSAKAVVPNTAHVAVGALVLAASVVLLLRVHHHKLEAIEEQSPVAWRPLKVSEAGLQEPTRTSI